MKNIAIFVSGSGESAERIIRLFNEGNRLKTVLVIVDNSATDLLLKIKNEDITLLHIPDEEWHLKTTEIADLLKENEVRLIVLDNFGLSIADEILESTEGEMIRVSSPELAPREVVAALEADLRKPLETRVEPEPIKEENPTPEQEWADALEIRFKVPDVPKTPPEVPDTPSSNSDPATSYDNSSNAFDNHSERLEKQFHNQNFEPRDNKNWRKPHHHEEPMPSTWLIWSVLATIFCCFIPGIVAIIFSSQVSTRYYAGDLEGAKRASRMAEGWIIASVVLGVVAATLYLPFMILG